MSAAGHFDGAEPPTLTSRGRWTGLKLQVLHTVSLRPVFKGSEGVIATMLGLPEWQVKAAIESLAAAGEITLAAGCWVAGTGRLPPKPSRRKR